MAPPTLTFEELYAGLMVRNHAASRFVDAEFLRLTGFEDRVRELLTVSGWPGLLTFHSETDVEDTCEFLAFFRYIGQQDHEGIAYWHRGVWHTITPPQIREVFGWQPGGEWIRDEFALVDAWARVQIPRASAGMFTPNKTRVNFIRDPVLFYIQKLLGNTIFARVNGIDKLTYSDMICLNDMDQGRRVNYCHLLCLFWKGRPAAGPVIYGGMITYLLRCLHG